MSAHLRLSASGTPACPALLRRNSSSYMIVLVQRAVPHELFTSEPWPQSYIWCFLNRDDSWQCSRNNETQKSKHVGGLSAAKLWDPKEKSGLPAKFTGKKDSTNIWTGGRIKMQNGFELIPST